MPAASTRKGRTKKSPNSVGSIMRVADYIAGFLADHGIVDVFLVTGGGAMHLNDGIGRESRLNYVCCHHEQACSIAAEGVFRVTGRPAAVNVTTGPGGINALNGVHGAFTDSIAMIVVSGQVKRETMAAHSGLPLRQLGDQEVDIVALARPVTKYAVSVTEPGDIRYHLEKALHLATTGRPGPVWLDIPVDVQAAQVEPGTLRRFDPAAEPYAIPSEARTLTGPALVAAARAVLDRLAAAERPVIIPGSGVRISGGFDLFRKVTARLGVAIAPAFNAHDVVAEDHPLYAGRPGTIGDRAGNFAVQNADFVLVLGCRLNIRQISYNWGSFAKNAVKAMVDVDKAELVKPTLSIDIPVHADLKQFLATLDSLLDGYRLVPAHGEYVAWCQERRRLYPVVRPEYWAAGAPINPYCFMERLFDSLQPGDIVVCANATACVVAFQAGRIKEGVRLFSNSGSASMGYDLPAAIGAARGKPGARVVCLSGDGSIMMNLQELQTIIGYNLPIKIFLLDNGGYHSIRQTQANYFPDNPVGVGRESGVTFPDFTRLAAVFGFPARRVADHAGLDGAILATLGGEGPQFCQVDLDQTQPFSPKLASRVLPDGKMATPSLEDMAPFLPRDELASNMFHPVAD